MNMKTTMIALAALAMSGTVYANDGIVRVPGLTKAIFTGSEFDITSDVYSNAIERVDFAAEMYASSLNEYTTVAWAGYMKMEAGVKYTFKGCYDDFVAVKIDGRWIVSKGGGCVERSGTFTPAETGWYSVDFRVGNGPSAGGCQNSSQYGIVWNTSSDNRWRSVYNGVFRNVISGGQFETLKDDTIPYVESIPGFNKATTVQLVNIKCQQRYPWNGMVDIDYTVRSDDPNAEVWVYPIGYDKDSNMSMAPRSLTGDGVDAPVSNGTFRMTWKVTDDYPEFHSTAFTVKMIALTGSAPYMVVDLSGGVDALSYPVTYLSSVPEGGWGDEYKTTKLVLRLIPPGSFMMGSPSDELGRNGSDESLRGVVLTKPFYIGVFEVTQKQYELVMGSIPSVRANGTGDKYPVSGVSYTDIRGTVNGIGWPTHNQVDANSFMGRLRSKVNMLFDLPTESQWEYACRAGTSSALNSGKSLTSSSGACANLDEVAWYYNNAGAPKAVGQKVCNNWGLYDMHGNVNEWCLDYWISNLGSVAVIDPKGASSASSSYRVFRGGGYGGEATYNYFRRGSASACRSASRGGQTQTTRDYYGYCGFRVMCSPVAE